MNIPWSFELPEGPGETIPSRGRTWKVSNHLQAKRSSSPVKLDLLTAVPSSWFVPETKELLEQSTAFDRSNSLTYHDYYQFR